MWAATKQGPSRQSLTNKREAIESLLPLVYAHLYLMPVTTRMSRYGSITPAAPGSVPKYRLYDCDGRCAGCQYEGQCDGQLWEHVYWANRSQYRLADIEAAIAQMRRETVETLWGPVDGETVAEALEQVYMLPLFEDLSTAPFPPETIQRLQDVASAGVDWLARHIQGEIVGDDTWRGRRRFSRPRVRSQRKMSASSKASRGRWTERDDLEPLLAAAKQGDEGAKEELARRYRTFVGQQAYSAWVKATDGDSSSVPLEDFVQDAWVGFWEAVRYYEQGKGPFGQIVSWLMANEFDKRRVSIAAQSEPYYDNVDDTGRETRPSGDVGRRALGRDLARAIMTQGQERELNAVEAFLAEEADERVGQIIARLPEVLTPEEFELLARWSGIAGYERMTQEELARELGITQPAVCLRIERILKKCREMLIF